MAYYKRIAYVNIAYNDVLNVPNSIESSLKCACIKQDSVLPRRRDEIHAYLYRKF